MYYVAASLLTGWTGAKDIWLLWSPASPRPSILQYPRINLLGGFPSSVWFLQVRSLPLNESHSFR